MPRALEKADDLAINGTIYGFNRGVRDIFKISQFACPSACFQLKRCVCRNDYVVLFYAKQGYFFHSWSQGSVKKAGSEPQCSVSRNEDLHGYLPWYIRGPVVDSQRVRFPSSARFSGGPSETVVPPGGWTRYEIVGQFQMWKIVTWPATSHILFRPTPAKPLPSSQCHLDPPAERGPHP